MLKIKTEASTFNCGDKLVVKHNEAGYVILIQNTDSSVITYQLQEYKEGVMDSSSSKGIVIGILVALLVFGGFIGFMYMRKKKMLQAALEREHQGRPLID